MRTQQLISPLAHQIAKTCHEVNRAYCLSIGDDSHKPWDETPEMIQKSVISGVRIKLENQDVTPEQSHEGWLEYKRVEGWVYGEVKDLEAKTHPCMVPYDQLPEEQRLKDELFLAVIESFLVEPTKRSLL
jgi:hypothetical protein